MATDLGNPEKIAQLPKEGVHCYAANPKQISRNRIISAIIFVIAAALSGYMFYDKNFVMGAVFAAVAVICVLVFCQTFLTAKYRVAVDYNAKQIILRYRYSKITIPFENFDAREGEPDKAEELLENAGPVHEKVFYLVLDDVFEEACYQTSSKDLESKEDFFKLRDESYAIAEAYGARDSEDAIKPMDFARDTALKTANVGDDDIADILNAAEAEDKGEATEESKDEE